MTSNSDDISEREKERIRLWRQDMIDCLDPNAALVARAIHGKRGAMAALLRLCHSRSRNLAESMGLRLLWIQMSREPGVAIEFPQTPPEEERPCQSP